jgi:predicted membrane protein
MAETKLHGRGILGIVLVLIGLAILARSIDLFSPAVEDVLFNWPMILIVLGVLFLLTKSSITTGWILLLIGAVFWVPRVADFSIDFHEIFWPVLFIGIGIIILIRAFGNVGSKRASGDDKDYVDDIAIFGGNERKVTSKTFKGGKITSIFGGSKINLLDAQMAPGENVLDVFALFGGSTIIVPRNWEVKIEVASIFGGFEDKRHYEKQGEASDDKILIIKGAAIFGGGELKNI